MRRLPSARSVTRPASLSTLRCWDTAGRLTGSSRASSPTARGRSARRSKISRRVGSPSAESAWVVVSLVIAYRKRDLTIYLDTVPRLGRVLEYEERTWQSD